MGKEGKYLSMTKTVYNKPNTIIVASGKYSISSKIRMKQGCLLSPLIFCMCMYIWCACMCVYTCACICVGVLLMHMCGNQSLVPGVFLSHSLPFMEMDLLLNHFSWTENSLTQAGLARLLALGVAYLHHSSTRIAGRSPNPIAPILGSHSKCCIIKLSS